MNEEFVAMRALLDNPAEAPVDGDRAHYVIGTLDSADLVVPHKVVLRHIGQAGTDVAAIACTNLIRSFPSVNYIVMAGTAAGIPNTAEPQRHVRLGDIVVATWGVIDYDHVDETVDGPVLRSGFPTPSPLLCQAANNLATKEAIGQRPWEHWLDCNRNSALAGYGRPADAKPARQPTGSPPSDATDNTRSRVHYGRIGSGDRSLRNARIRDMLAARHKLLAIEMEGKGVGNSAFLNGLEWFMVRGISDHGDERTDRTWRKHASLVAAAYTKALLAECRPTDRSGLPYNSKYHRKLLGDLLSDDTENQIHAARRINETRRRTAVPLLVESLRTARDPEARYWMIFALGQIGGRDGLAALRRLDPLFESDKIAINDVLGSTDDGPAPPPGH